MPYKLYLEKHDRENKRKIQKKSVDSNIYTKNNNLNHISLNYLLTYNKFSL